jgi:hypothetical protein
LLARASRTGGKVTTLQDSAHNGQYARARLKQSILPTRSARATISGFELMRMFRKGQFRFWIEAIGGGTEVRFINRLFGLYA